LLGENEAAGMTKSFEELLDEVDFKGGIEALLAACSAFSFR
jgi:hypothetical protein